MLSDPVVYIHFILKDESYKKTEKRGTEKQKKFFKISRNSLSLSLSLSDE